ncbi:MAG TPA: hypothetical protein VE262_23680 [Blastocatellia bacterium]|nr:hypothetical protein [Blastocatellia bacterium]
MADEHIATYLNDHLAGSVVAVELLEHLEEAHADNAIGRFVAELRADIEADRQELESFMDRLNVNRSLARRATAWLTEKVAELKLRVDDPSGGALRLLEALEAVEVGVEGKRALWTALAAAAEDAPDLRLLDYERLTQRAMEQHRRLEEVRLIAAKKALGAAR